MKKKPEDDEAKLAETRKKFFDESRFDPNNQKFGLFSYTGTLAISDKPYFIKTSSHKGVDGRVVTNPSNFLTNPGKRGKTPNTYFSLPEYKSEPYLDPNKPYLKEKINDEQRRKCHDLAWKPGGPLTERPSLYPHLPSDNHSKTSRKGTDGLVTLEPKNFYTSPPKIGSAMITPGVLIGGNKHEYVSDPYDRKHKLLLEEKKKNASKLQSESFKPPNPGNLPFFSDKDTYGEDPSTNKKLKKAKSQSTYKIAVPFVPSNPSKKGSTIGKYPEHQADPFISPERRPATEQIPWRHTTNVRSKPTPSVTNLIYNLRTEYPILKKNH